MFTIHIVAFHCKDKKYFEVIVVLVFYLRLEMLFFFLAENYSVYMSSRNFQG